MILSKFADRVRQRFPANDGREVTVLFTMSGNACQEQGQW